MRTDSGQAIAEAAILMTVFLPLMLAASQIALLLSYRLAQQQANGTLAALAAVDGPGAAFEAAVASESTRIRCESPVASIETPEPAIVVVGLRCTWRAPVYRDAAWPVSTSASAALAPTPSPSPTPSPEATP